MDKVLILDLDGVLYRWHNAVYEYFKLYRNYSKTFECLWGKDYLEFSKEDWEYLTNIDILYSSQLPTKDCMDFLNYVKYRYTIYYLTGRPVFVKTTTEQFLKRYKFPFRDNLLFETDKANTARRLKADFCIDDLPRNLDELSKVSRVGMISQPYNLDYTDKYPTSRTLMGMIPYMENHEYCNTD